MAELQASVNEKTAALAAAVKDAEDKAAAVKSAEEQLALSKKTVETNTKQSSLQVKARRDAHLLMLPDSALPCDLRALALTHRTPCRVCCSLPLCSPVCAQSKVAEAKKEWDEALKAKEREWQDETDRKARGVAASCVCISMRAHRAGGC